MHLDVYVVKISALQVKRKYKKYQKQFFFRTSGTPFIKEDAQERKKRWRNTLHLARMFSIVSRTRYWFGSSAKDGSVLWFDQKHLVEMATAMKSLSNILYIVTMGKKNKEKLFFQIGLKIFSFGGKRLLLHCRSFSTSSFFYFSSSSSWCLERERQKEKTNETTEFFLEIICSLNFINDRTWHG